MVLKTIDGRIGHGMLQAVSISYLKIVCTLYVAACCCGKNRSKTLHLTRPMNEADFQGCKWNFSNLKSAAVTTRLGSMIYFYPQPRHYKKYHLRLVRKKPNRRSDRRLILGVQAALQCTNFYFQSCRKSEICW